MEDIYKLLKELEDLLDNSRAVPFSSKIGIDKEEVYDILTDIRNAMPNEIKQSKLIVQERNKILLSAKQEADDILKEADDKVERLIEEHEITRQAYQQSSEMLEKARREAKDLRLGAMEYADELLASAEDKMRETVENLHNECIALDEYFNDSLNTLYENRQELRGIDDQK